MEQIIWTTEKRRAEELSPAPYNPLIIDRWEKFTGKKAEKINGAG